MRKPLYHGSLYAREWDLRQIPLRLLLSATVVFSLTWLLGLLN